MQNGEQSIRDLILDWLSATATGDLSKILPLMSEDVVFLIAGQPSMRGRDAFAATFQAGLGKVRIEPKSTIHEVHMTGNFAYYWNHLQVTITALPAGVPMRRSGYTLTVLCKEVDGRWVVLRDANMLMQDSLQDSRY